MIGAEWIVASFIGSPAMNIAQAEVTVSNCGLACRVGEQTHAA
jgi:ABC-type sugar transport system ATPase subunit